MKNLVFLVVVALAVFAGAAFYGQYWPLGERPNPFGSKPATYRVVRTDLKWFAEHVGKGTLTVKNDLDHTAFIKLLNQSGQRKVCAGLILPNDSLVIAGIPDGTYSLDYALGDEIIAGTEKLWDPVACLRVRGPLAFTTERVASHTSVPFGKHSVRITDSVKMEPTTMTIALPPVDGGDGKSDPVSARAFARE